MRWTTLIPREGGQRTETRFLLLPRCVDRGGYREWFWLCRVRVSWEVAEREGYRWWRICDIRAVAE